MGHELKLLLFSVSSLRSIAGHVAWVMTVDMNHCDWKVFWKNVHWTIPEIELKNLKGQHSAVIYTEVTCVSEDEWRC